MSKLKLDPPTKFHKSTYLGCQQEDFVATSEELELQRAFFERTFADEAVQFKTSESTLLTELRTANLSKRQTQYD